MLNNRYKQILVLIILILIKNAVGYAADANVTHPINNDDRMQWWREARFGVFIHWGLYAALDDELSSLLENKTEVYAQSSWLMATAGISVDRYEKLASQFNPVKFNAAEWVRAIKNAGAKYVVVTSKHHEGFSMFDTKVNNYNIVNGTPYGKDPLKALSNECKKAGIAFGVYYSILDWHHPSQILNPDRKGYKKYKDNLMQDGSKEKYVADMKAQLRELIEQYDPQILWFDGDWVKWWHTEDGMQLVGYLRNLKPSLIINNRVSKRARDGGDFGTPEQKIPDTALNYDWETCMTMDKYSWGYSRFDKEFKSSTVLIKNLVDVVSKGGNYLLNVGPDANGVIPEECTARLYEIGKWLNVNGDAVYGAKTCSLAMPSWGRYTQKGNVIYANIFDWPENLQIKIPNLEIKSIILLTPQKPIFLKTEKLESETLVYLPQKAPFEAVSVVVIEIEKKLP
jgi:alpha-L-fucosidase